MKKKIRSSARVEQNYEYVNFQCQKESLTLNLHHMKNYVSLSIVLKLRTLNNILNYVNKISFEITYENILIKNICIKKTRT